MSDVVKPLDYLATLPDDRRELVSTIRDVIRAHLPDGIEEGMGEGALTYYLPLGRFGRTYDGQPLQTAALASQDRFVSLDLTGLCTDEREVARFKDAWTSTGKPLDMGKSTVHFSRRDEVPLVVIGDAITRIGPEDLITAHDRLHPTE